MVSLEYIDSKTREVISAEFLGEYDGHKLKKEELTVKNKSKRLSLLALIIVLIIFLFVSNFNRMRLWIKGYGFSEQNILLQLDKSWLNEYLELDSV